jgi:hypothetical protein
MLLLEWECVEHACVILCILFILCEGRCRVVSSQRVYSHVCAWLSLCKCAHKWPWQRKGQA